MKKSTTLLKTATKAVNYSYKNHNFDNKSNLNNNSNKNSNKNKWMTMKIT